MMTAHPTFRKLLTMITLALSLVLAASALATPTLEITPTRIQPGDIVLITYDNFMPGGYDASINIDGVPVQDIFIQPGGSGSVFWPTPADLTLGGHDVDICASCFQGDLEERTNSVRLTVESGELSGNQFNLQPWAIEITQGVRGDIPTRTPPSEDLVFPDEDIVHVANRRTVVRVFPWVEGGPEFYGQGGVMAQLWVSVGGETYGPLEPESSNGVAVYRSATMEDLRASLRRTWNFVLPPEVTQLATDEELGSFGLTVLINPVGGDYVPECDGCLDDNTAFLYNNQFRHVRGDGFYALKFRPHLVEAEVEQEDGSTRLFSRPTLDQLAETVRSLHQVLPVADGGRGILVLPAIDVDWTGTYEEEGGVQDEFLVANYLPSGEVSAVPPNDYYAFLYSGEYSCGGHAYLSTPFLRSAVCGAPTYTAAHELTHAIGSAHAGYGHGEANGGGYDPNYPGYHGQVESNSYGMDVYNLRLYTPTLRYSAGDLRHDFMSYGPDKWVSSYTWNLVAANLGAPEINAYKASGTPSILSAPDRQDILDNVAFRGLLTGDGAVDLQPFVASYPAQSQGDGTYELEFYDAGNSLLASHLPQPIFSQDVENPQGMFAESVALPVGWSEMRLRENGTVTQTWQRSANPPTVAVTAPATGFQWPNTGNVTLTWDGDDLDGDDLTYRLFAWQVNSNELFSLGNGLVAESFTLDRSELPSGGDWAFIVEASDGLDRTYSEFVTGYVQPTPPQVLIVQPADNSVQVAGSTIPAMGMAVDLQGEITEGNMIWYLDGNYLGAGTTVEVPQVTAGNHELTFTVYNSLQVEGSTSINIQVVSDLETPQLTAPADGASGVILPEDLSWSEVPGAISYRVQVAADPNFSGVVAEVGNLGDPTLSFEAPLADGTYYWRAMAEHGSEPSGWSVSWSFTLESASSVNELPAAPALDLAVYPNPFNPNTTVSFNLPRDGYVTLTVYDLAGRLVRKLAEGTYQQGHYDLDWDGRNEQGLSASSGIYLVRLVTPSGTTSQQATLLK